MKKKPLIRGFEFCLYFSMTCWILYQFQEYFVWGLGLIIPAFLTGFRFPSRVWRWGFILNLTPMIVAIVDLLSIRNIDPVSFNWGLFVFPIVVVISFVMIAPYTMIGVYTGYWAYLLFTDSRIYFPRKTNVS